MKPPPPASGLASTTARIEGLETAAPAWDILCSIPRTQSRVRNRRARVVQTFSVARTISAVTKPPRPRGPDTEDESDGVQIKETFAPAWA